MAIRNKIYAIVEGQGDAKAIIPLIAKLLSQQRYYELYPGSPAFRLHSGGKFLTEKLDKALRRYKYKDDCATVLILFDADENCPIERATMVYKRIQNMESLPFSVAVVCAKSEYEAWFLASLETIHNQTYPNDPEAIRDAKGWLKKNFGYKQTRNQAEYTKLLDCHKAGQNSRSFRHLIKVFAELIEAHQNNQLIITPVFK